MNNRHERSDPAPPVEDTWNTDFDRVFVYPDGGNYVNLADAQAHIANLDTENSPVGERLFHIWKFAPEIFKRFNIPVPVQCHIELGTYNAYQLPEIAKWAKRTIAVDNSMSQQGVVSNRPEIIQLKEQGRLGLHFGDATNLQNTLPSEIATTVSAVEIFGARKDQVDAEDVVMGISGEAYRLLKPGGVFFFTILNDKLSLWAEEESFGAIATSRGIATTQENMDSIMHYIFHENPVWYGQNIYTYNKSSRRWLSPRGLIPHPQDLSPRGEVLTPKLITDPTTQSPQYWIGAVQKAA